MRIKVLIMSSLLLLAFFAIKSYSVDWDNAEGQSADDLFSSGNDIVLPSYTEQAQASRAAQFGSSGATNPQEARSQDQNLTAANPTVIADANAQVKPTMSSELAIVSGSWSLELNDSASHKAVLTMFQNGDAVYGTGNLNLDANTTMAAAASGTVTGDQINLDVVSSGKVSLYRISMTVNGNSTTGSYTTFDPGLPPSTGTVKGLRLA
jgi:hypothetical protein